MKYLSLIVVAMMLAGTAQGMTKHLVKVRVFSQPIDEQSPWSQLPIKESSHVGVVVKPQEIMVPAYTVQAARYLEVETFFSSKPIKARVYRVDSNAQLAILKIDQTLDKLAPIPFGDDLGLNDRVQVLTVKQKRIVPLRSTFRELKIRSSLLANYNLPHMAFEVKQQSVGWSEPIVRKNKLVGLSVRKEKNQIFALPISVIKRFLAAESESTSFGRLGIRFNRLTSTLLRKKIKLDREGQGVWVSEVSALSPFFGQVKESDVLLKLGGYAISDKGTIREARWGRIPLSGIVYRFQVGKKVPLELLRDGELIKVSMEMKPYEGSEDLIPFYGNYERKFLIYGGLVFQELTRNYLQSWGKSWMRRAPLPLLNRYFYGNQLEPNNLDQRIIILSKVLVDDWNKGYEDLKNQEIISINDKKVANLSSIRDALDKPLTKNDQQFTKINLGPRPQELVLVHKDISAIHDRIAKVYAVPVSAFWKSQQGSSDQGAEPEAN
ncbi:PDZ domain-containing protein [Pseudobacteriovorax antillogorgiicola]|uniref:Serine protease, S1-C subfamily, contains C-terminal PDZ domain n=1 Tax=Pseudobacteriovorax antillogorgiicola TaxID=1513793 RepID=A0A1Y6C0M6_9BACT|nr:PDZ domain-containing protein [Pseudobacteriovorax antillogorgiicola]TCS51150.1 S1-C subfamily serine protease [Pseudobacteriovorax antillogorgiicola]SMF38251.1 serine protease, S1-C subfamily, contains C-terminal PDZ domain [Pseudobacteriovorax antillogorgiicola]